MPFFGSPDLDNIKEVVGYQPRLEVRLCGRNKHNHEVSISIGESQTSTFDFDDFTRYEMLTQTFDWGFDQVENNSLSTIGSVNGDGVNADRISVVYSKYFFPINADVNNTTPFLFNSFEESEMAVNVDFFNVPFGSVAFDLSDEYNIVELYSSGNNFILNRLDEGNKSYILLTSEDYLTPSRINPVSFINDLEVASLDYLIVYHSKFKEQAENFKSYRESLDGGGYKVKIVDQDRLFNQYSYGDRTPLSIQNFCHYMIANYELSYLLLLGNGSVVSLKNGGVDYYRKTPFFHDKYPNQDYVMTMGNPGSDAQFTNKLDGVSLKLELATGRIPCYTTEEAQNYLDKVIEHESIGYDDLGRKNLLHLSGGTSEEESNMFLGLMNGFKDQAVGLHYGAEVETQSKNTDDAVQFVNVSKPVNAGVGMLTYLGHSAPNYTGLDIGMVSNDLNGYRNKGKYTLLWINGCQSTDVFNSYFRVRARDWMFTKDRGAIGVFGHGSFGYTFTLSSYTETFYKYAFQDTSYSHRSLGEVQQKVIESFSEGKENNIYYNSHSQQFNYLGDPAIHYFTPKFADYAIDNKSISIVPFSGKGDITAVSDSFQIQIDISNYGRAFDDSLSICIEREYADGILEYETKTFPIYHQEKITYTIVNESKEAGGINVFNVLLDCNKEYQELNKENNFASFEYLIPFNGVSLLYPREFAIVKEQVVDLVFQSNDLLVKDEFTYELELDTSLSFSAPLFKVTAKGDIVATIKDFKLPFTADSTVYYWRVKLNEEIDSVEAQWTMSSFTYIPEQTGWGQMEIGQFYDNSLTHIYRDLPLGIWKFDSTGSHIVANTVGDDVPSYEIGSHISVDDQSIVIWGGRAGCTKNGLWIIVFDSETALPYNTQPGEGGKCGRLPRQLAKSFSSLNNASNQSAVVNFLNTISKNDMVLVVSCGTHYATQWSDEMKNKLREFGAELLDDIPSDNHPYVFLGQDGSSNALSEEYAETLSDTLSLDYDLVGRMTMGVIRSPVVGPTTDWSSYSHDFSTEGNDSLTVLIYGIDKEGERENEPLYIIENKEKVLIDLRNEYYIDANLYPSLQLEAFLYDTLDNTVAQLNHWAVTCSEIPEAVVNTTIEGVDSYYLDKIEQGGNLELTYHFQNISPVDFRDSIKVELRVLGTVTDSVIVTKMGPLKSGDTLSYSVSISTKKFTGENKVQVYFNPFDQLEAVYENNILVLPFDVLEDQGSPVTDVLFDDVHITDGDLVSPSPSISIYYHDNNNKLLKEDTVGIFLYFKSPCDSILCGYKRIYFSSTDILSWSNQTLGSPFAIEYKPGNLSDGLYQFKVQGQDQVGNVSGIVPYEVSFTVINERTISDFQVFPNPFRHSCQFSFTLTGDAVPEEVSIEIFSLTGVLVKTISYQELGPIHAGHNTTEFAWEGTDDNGAMLTNGMYIYHVIINNGDTGIKNTSSSKDNSRQGVGKVMIMK